jgi:hypothetical protein
MQLKIQTSLNLRFEIIIIGYRPNMAVISFHRLFYDFSLCGLLALSLNQISSYSSYIVKSFWSCIFLSPLTDDILSFYDKPK